MLRSIMTHLRDADWLTPNRARVYGAMLAFGLLAMTAWLSLAPLRAAIPGGDFVSFYSASVLALGGHAAAAWQPDLHQAVEQAVLPGFSGYLAFFYPPPYLLVCWPLALLPYGAALVLWQALLVMAMAGAVVVLMRAPAPWWMMALLVLALPATWVNVLAGQNGALCVAIMAAGLALIDRRPVWAGAVLGLLVIKPQLAVVLPFVLAASGRWRTLLATGASALGLLLLAWPMVGTEGYAAFLANLTAARTALDAGGVDPRLLQSLFGMLPAGPAAYVAQALLILAVLWVACETARRSRPDGPALAALVGSATLAATPFLLDYDLVLMALPIAWIVGRGSGRGFLPWEKAACLLCAAFPLFARPLALGLNLHPGPLAALLLLALVVRRLRAEGIGARVPAHAL